MSRVSFGSTGSKSKRGGFRFVDLFSCQSTSSIILSSTKPARKRSSNPRVDFDTSNPTWKSNESSTTSEVCETAREQDEQNTYEYSSQISKFKI